MNDEFTDTARGRFFQVRSDGKIRAVTEAEYQRETHMSEASTDRQLPRYQCHKQVSALKIATVQPVVGGSAIITPADEGYAPFNVTQQYVDKHKPQAGGFFVVYDDGYESYSPAQAFEEGYTLITDADKPFDWAALQKLRKEAP